MSGRDDSGPDAYRQAPIQCPQCSTLMEQRQVEVDGEAAVVDVCGDCGGVWIDESDGPVGPVTRRAIADDPANIGREDEDARPTCPRDGEYLDLDFENAAAAVLHRCGVCRGTFVTRLQAEKIAVGRDGKQDFTRALARARAARSKK